MGTIEKQLERLKQPLSLNEWKPLLEDIFRAHKEREVFEQLGKLLSVEQFLALLQICQTEGSPAQNRLLTLLVGLPEAVFAKALIHCDKGHLAPLSQLADTEPLHYQITRTIHRFESWADQSSKDLETKWDTLRLRNLSRVTPAQLESFIDQIDHFSNQAHLRVHAIDRMLSLAWKAGNKELITELSRLKENWLLYLREALGHPPSGTEEATGIYAELENHLGQVFGNKKSQSSALADSDPAIDGVAAFGAWYPEDFWRLGLLPGIADPATLLEEQEKLQSPEPWRKLRGALTRHAEGNLERIGLSTVGDLKGAHIFSLEALEQYVAARKDQLEPAISLIEV